MSTSVAIYVRLSDEDKDKKYKGDESCSIQNQKALLSAYCKERNWDIYDIYVDDGYSGVSKNRPAFNRMINDCKNGFINIVLCKDQSRFSRDIVVVEQYINDLFLDWGVRFIGVTDNADTESEFYDTTRLLQGAFNELYVKDISRKVSRVLKYKREQGQFTGSFAPYGYSIDPLNKNHLVIDENVACNVKLIFDLYLQGYSYTNIVQVLNDMQIPNPTQYKEMCNSNFHNANVQSSANKGLWTNTTIYQMIRNETYTGTLVQGKTHNISYKNKKRKKVPEKNWIRVYNTHEPIISYEIWDKVQERLHSKQRALKTTQVLSPLSGMVKCAVCGSAMKREVYHNKSKTRTYYGLICGTNKIGSKNCINKGRISGLQLESYIVEQINRHIQNYCDIDSITLIDRQTEQLKRCSAELVDLNRQQEQAERKITMLYEDKLNGVIDTEQYKMYEQKFRENLSTIKKNISRKQEQIKNIESSKTDEVYKRNIITKYSHIEKLTRDIADNFIDTVTIGNIQETGERDITINWKI
ncbi:MAG: recombinase family protein [Oscillospiraceae bacterium]|nr:recombinase family protein [Oscillospiraceae bacterium]